VLVQTLSLRGEVVQLHEERGQRVMKVALGEPCNVDLTVVTPVDVHLRDAVWIDAHIELSGGGHGAPPSNDGPSQETGGFDER